MLETKPILESENYIVLANYEKLPKTQTSYQSESALENEFIQDLINLGYEKIKFANQDEFLANLKNQIEKLNNVKFSPSEWQRFLNEYLNRPNDTYKDATRNLQENHIYDFTFDNGKIKNIKIIDKKDIYNNFLQVTNQFCQTGTHQNRYDVSVLINGLPIIHIELKRRGVSLNEAFNQIHRYLKESFNTQNSLYKYTQIFIISNGTFTRYFANTDIKSNKNSFEFSCEWADAKNRTISDLKDFTATFFQKKVLLEIVTKYCVFNANDELLIMRPYQIAASERILRKIESGYKNKKFGSSQAGGFIWHTTGSGKTLTSFKTSQLATKLDFIDKVLFVVDRKDLDYQTIKEYEKFQKNSVNGSKDTKELQQNIEKKDDKIVVTTIQKLNEFIKKNKTHEIYDKHCVLIFDECHRSQFGEAQKNIKKYFKKYYQFGFTGTPIFPENASGVQTTANTFGEELHSYVITDAIRDNKVLKFKVDYTNVSPFYQNAEKEQDLEKLKNEQKFLESQNRISKIVKHILDVYDAKTHRNEIYSIKDKRLKGFNAMLAVESIKAAKIYYFELKKQINELRDDKKLKIATIFSFAPNESASAKGEILDENFEPNFMDLSSKEFLDEVIKDYNKEFSTNYSIDSQNFQGYYKDLSRRVKNKEIDLLIVVGMFLTGFDAPTLNTLFVDKNLRYHGLIQAFSRTNRILNEVKNFGNIVCFRDLDNAVKDAIKLFSDENSLNIILEKSYDEYINGYKNEDGEFKGYKALCDEMLEKFKNPYEIELIEDKKEFAKLFGEILKTENILKNYDEFKNFESPIDDRFMQDLKSVYIQIKEEAYESKNKNLQNDKEKIDFSDIDFAIELLKTDEINLEYIFALIFDKTQENLDINTIRSDIKRTIKSSLDIRAKEGLIMEFLDSNDLKQFKNKEDILEKFFEFGKKKKDEDIEKLIKDENLKNENAKAKSFIEESLEKGFVEEYGTQIDDIMPATSRREEVGKREAKKQTILEKIRNFVKIYFGMKFEDK